MALTDVRFCWDVRTFFLGSASFWRPRHGDIMLHPLRVRREQANAMPRLLERATWQASDKADCAINLLSPDQQVKLGQIATTVRHERAGLEIVSESGEACAVFVIDEGVVAVSIALADGTRQVVDFARAGDLVGLCEHGHYVNSVETLTPVTLYRISQAALSQLLLNDGALHACLLAKVTNDLRVAQRRMVMLGRTNVIGRLAVFLLECRRAMDFQQSGDEMLRLPMNRFAIADYLGTSSESIARAFAALEEDGLIHRSSPRVLEMRDLQGLLLLAHGLSST